LPKTTCDQKLVLGGLEAEKVKLTGLKL